ncbi:unnamed protein product, partial [Choristocarpus tenellus]
MEYQESSPDMSQLPQFEVPFVPAVLGSGPLNLFFQVGNPGFLPTDFSVNLPNKKNIEMETWASEGEPTEEDLRQNDVIDCIKAFSLSPTSGTIIKVRAGESQLLQLSYNPCSLKYGGVHDLPILVQIREGRQFWLNLKGTTLAPMSSMLYIPTGLGREYNMCPVAVGTPLDEGPLQITELLNVGVANLKYEVDVGPIK